MQNDDMENVPIENNGRKWQFWFLVSFSLLLVVTFILYLPTRFERNFLREEFGHIEEMPHMDGEMMDMMHGEDHGGAVYHEEGEVTEGLVVNMNVSPIPVIVYSLAELNFFVNEKPSNEPIHFGLLDIDHTKFMHTIGVRSDLNEFFHIHPEPTHELGVLATAHIFSQPGRYKIWSEVKKDDVLHVFGHPSVSVEGEGEREAKEVNFERRVIVNNQYEVALVLQEPVEKGHNHRLSFDIRHGFDHGKIEVEDYLGAPMHLSLIKDDWTQLIHAHPKGDDHAKIPGSFGAIPIAKAHGPVEEGVPLEGDIRFQVTFPEMGLYKLFAQFRPQGSDLPEDEALLATFWVEVVEGSSKVPADHHLHAPGTPEDHHESTQLQPLVSPAWWLLLGVSLGLIGLLSFAVHKFITVKK